MKPIKKRRGFLKKTLLGVAAASLLPFRSSAQEAISGRFAHMVFFWLKEPDNDAFVNEFISGTRDFMSKIEVIRSVHIGKPAGTPRAVVDNSYTIALIVTFDSKEDQDKYQVHPAHVGYVAERKHMWEKVQVFDSWGLA